MPQPPNIPPTPSEDPQPRSDRRTFVKRAAIGGGLLAGGGIAIAELAGGSSHHGPRVPKVSRPARAAARRARRPNILVVMVDQLRTPQWFPSEQVLARRLPNIARLRRGAVSFDRHYVASNDCTPSRGVLVTGLYPHQTGCLVTGNSTLDPGFPTWGTLLREHGYETNWWGKWHLSKSDTLEPYGFGGGTFPSPDGGPGQGLRVDPSITNQFREWFAQSAANGPWCNTVSFVDPHDIAWWYRFTEQIVGESQVPSAFQGLPPNFETPQQHLERGKPLLQRSLQDTAATSFGAVPYSGPDAEVTWAAFLDVYLRLQQYVDHQVGRVLDTLASQPEVAANTVVVFTSDHGEYGGSHGMRGKGASAYEEAIRVPLYVKDPRGVLTSAPATPRRQLTSSADLAPLLLTIANGSNAWRQNPRYSHLARRLDLAAICASPAAAGRRWVLHATDEVVTEFAIEPYAAAAPRHVIAVRTANAKYATYSNWTPGSFTIEQTGQESELYDYGRTGGQLEIDNRAGQSRLEAPLRKLLEEHVIPHELREPLPSHLREAQRRGFANYFAVEVSQAAKAASHRRRRAARRLLPPQLRSVPGLPHHRFGNGGGLRPPAGGAYAPMGTAPGYRKKHRSGKRSGAG